MVAADIVLCLFLPGYIFYSYVFTSSSPGNPDYVRRWQNPGDETKTNVPSMVYSIDHSRDDFYLHQEIAPDRIVQDRLSNNGDHVKDYEMV